MGAILVTASDPTDRLLSGTQYASDVSRSWVHNEVGSAAMQLPISIPNLKDFLGWGHIIRIYEDDVPVWAGVVVQRRFRKGLVLLELKSLEWLLIKRPMQMLETIDGDLGLVARRCYESAMRMPGSWSPVKQGNFAGGGPAKWKKFEGYKDLWPTIKELADEDKWAVWVDQFAYVHFRPARGQDKSEDVTLYEDRQLIGVEVAEDINDAATNVLALTSEGSDVARKFKVGRQANWAFAAAHPTGVWKADVITVDSTVSVEQLKAPAELHLNDHYFPALTVDCVVVNEKRIWAQLQMGDTVSLVVWQGGERTIRARIEGMELSKQGEMRCVFKALPDKVVVAQPWLTTS